MRSALILALLLGACADGKAYKDVVASMVPSCPEPVVAAPPSPPRLTVPETLRTLYLRERAARVDRDRVIAECNASLAGAIKKSEAIK